MSQTIPKEPSICAPLGEALVCIQGLETGDRQFEALIENGPGACYLIDAKSHTIRYLSNKAFEFMPQSFKTLLNERETWSNLVCAEDRPQYKTVIEKLGESGDEAMIVYRLDTSKKGSWLPVKDYVTPLRNSENELVGYLGRIIDDSFRIQAMDILVKRSWKEVATTLTKRFLHDFNNMIAGIFSLSELYAVPGSDAETMTEAMIHIRDSSIRAQKITKQIRALTSMTDGEASYFEIPQLIKEQEDYIRAILPQHVELIFNLSDESLPARLDANRFKQAILHLVSNASDAANDKPSISISCAATSNPDSDNPNRSAQIEFKDNGHGIKERHLKQVADPFYTTKDPKSHVGMGLFIVKRFTEELGGDMTIVSALGEGTSITMHLPLANLSETIPATPTTYPQDAAAPSVQPKRTPTILIYSWEDTTRHPLVNAIRSADWKFRIHIDTHQLLLDLKELREDLDGILVFKSSLDEKFDPLIATLSEEASSPKLAVIALDDSLESMDERIQSQCGLLASGASKPNGLLKKLSKHFS
ncbi:MAG: PAS domain-containing protein [Opitutales bacterium]|nr:PAS domain-containing protein [Opitutales bacterium]